MEAISAGTGASITVAALARRWFRQAVQEVVEKRTGDLQRHLERQDRRLESIERKLNRR